MKPPSLRELQERLSRVILDPKGVEHGLASDPALGEFLNETPQFSRSERVFRYANNYFRKVREGLYTEYEAFGRLISDSTFAALVEEYLETRYSDSPIHLDVGAEFPAFISRHPILRRAPYLLDLAQLEWTVSQVLFSTNLREGRGEKSWRVGPSAAVVHPTLQVIELDWPVFQLWTNRLKKTPSKLPKLKKRTQRIAVLHCEYGVRVIPLTRAEHQIIQFFKSPRNYHQTKAELAIPPAKLRALLKKLASQHILIPDADQQTRLSAA